VVEFDTKGNFIKAWGGPGAGYDWPVMEHSIYVDQTGNVWISGNGMGDRQVIKFTNDGKFLMQIGHPAPGNADSLSKTLLDGVTGVDVDEKAHEVYLADGDKNRRIIVFDSNTGEFKRMWGAYGHVPDDTDLGPYKPTDPPAQQFRGPVHCVSLSNDGLVYVCDRGNKRVQVFTKDGKFVKEFMVPDATARAEMQGSGSASALAFSRDKEQKYLFAIDGENNVIWILQRSDGAVMGKFGGKGTDPGQFTRSHSLSEDADGNLYTGELAPGSRMQKFVLVAGNASKAKK
jgi:DNA-binding beta-propeller fold protein YncE